MLYKNRTKLILLSACDLLRTHEVCHMINGSGCPTKFAVNDTESSPKEISKYGGKSGGSLLRTCLQTYNVVYHLL